MNPRRAQLRIAAAYALTSTIVVAVLTVIAVHGGTDRIHNATERSITNRVSSIVATIDVSHPPNDEYNAWLVDAQNENATKLSDTDIEPPLIGLAKDIIANGPEYREFAQDSQPYLLYGQRLPNSQLVIAAAEPLTDEHGATSSLRLRLWLLAIGLIVATSLLSYLIAGWALRPARRAHEQQRVFLANAAHELRTPLAVIRASASQALRRERSPDEYVRSLTEIDGAAVRASDLVGDMLELARLDAGQINLRRAPLRLDLLAEEVADVVGRGRVPVEACPGVSVIVDADYGLLRQALENVVRNAALRAEHVSIEVRADGANAVVEVRDDGPGFEAALLPTVFERFRRGDQDTDRESTGLGLAIVQSIVQAHGGDAQAANNESGGALVTLRVPRSRR